MRRRIFKLAEQYLEPVNVEKADHAFRVTLGRNSLVDLVNQPRKDHDVECLREGVALVQGLNTVLRLDDRLSPDVDILLRHLLQKLPRAESQQLRSFGEVLLGVGKHSHDQLVVTVFFETNVPEQQKS